MRSGLTKGLPMPTAKILHLLMEHGQLRDSEIVAYTKISLDQVRASIDELSAQGKIYTCASTTFKDGKAVEGFQCRVFGYVPRAARGRKPGK